MRIHVAIARGAGASSSTRRRSRFVRRPFVPSRHLISLGSLLALITVLNPSPVWPSPVWPSSTWPSSIAPSSAGHALALAEQAPAESPRAMAYVAIVRAYQQGEADAVARVAELWRAGSEGADREMAKVIDVTLAPAALALHLDAAWQALGANADQDVTAHLRQAGAIAQADVVRQSPAARAARRDFYVLGAWMYATTRAFDAMATHLQRAKEAFPDDPEIALAEGSAREATLPAIEDVRRGATSGPAFGTRRPISASAAWSLWVANQGVIVSLYERAMTAPTAETAIEARVRLISLYQRTKRATPARKARDEAFAAFTKLNGVERQRVRPLEYLAHMFAARVASDEEDWAAALREYRIGALLCTAAPAALVGRAHASVMAGRESDAREATKVMLAIGPDEAAADAASGTAALIARDRCSGDPWLRYDLGQGWRLNAGIAELRARVRR